MREEARQRRALVLHHFRHVGAGEGETDEERRDEHHRQAERAARGFEQQQDAGAGGDEVERGRLAGPQRELAIEQEQIGAAQRRRARAKHPVDGGNVSRGDDLNAG